jgi:D-alanyl-D-alanine carboxypeptidase
MACSTRRLITRTLSMRRASPGPRLAAVGLLATLTFAGVEGNRAKARGTPAHAHDAHKGAAHEAHKEGKGGRHGVQKHAAPLHGSSYHPPYAAIVVDDNTDRAIYEVNADEPRHPASLTKIMTLYMLFEQLEAGKLKLDSQLPVSAHAAGQAPVKLGLKAGQTIAVEDALRAMVTKSANDAACVVAEAIGGGDEAEGARLMTAKARVLGMSGTTYVNGSGLPAEEQITTARDQALLGLAIHNRFPNYYTYFSTPSFNWHGREMRNHNGLLGNVRGVDGIKTGYTEASGYNLVASVTRDGRHIVSVVLGGTSNGQRDNLMRKLIEDEIPFASVQRTAPPIMEAAHPEGPPSNPILTVAGTPPVTPAFAPAAAAAAVPPAAAAAPAALMAVPAAVPAVALRGSGANPVVPVSTTLPATATLRSGAAPAVAATKANQAHGQKPHVQSAKLQTHVPGQPQAPAAKPAAPAAHVAHQGALTPSSKAPPNATAGAQQRRVPTRPSVP